MMELNLNLNLVTGEGNAYGNHTINANGIDDGWEGSYTGTIGNYVYSGKAVSKETGEWEGFLQKIYIQQSGETTLKLLVMS